MENENIKTNDTSINDESTTNIINTAVTDGIGETINDLMNNIPSYLKFGIIAILAIIIGTLGLIFCPDVLSSYPAIIGNVGFGIGIWWAIDKFVLKTIDTIEEIKKGNIAFGLLLLAIAIIIGAAISAT